MSDTHYHESSTLHKLLKVCQKMAIYKIKLGVCTNIWTIKIIDFDLFR